MKSLSKFTISERSLLLFFETQSVDHAGRVDTRRMNEDDLKIAKQWNKDKFISFGRIASDDVFKSFAKWRNHWVILSEEAWLLAHQERRNRSKRMWKNRTWQTTAEINA